MTKTDALRPFEAELLPMLSEAARQAPSAVSPSGNVSSTRRSFVVVATVAVALALAAPFLSDDPLGGALAIEQRGDTLHLSVKDAAADPEAMTNDLRAHGLPANVEVVPVSPSLEGTWIDIVNDNLDAGYNDPRISEVFQQMTERPKVLELPADFSTPFTLVVGRPAVEGEAYMIAHESDVEHAYACLGLAGLSPEEADESLGSRGYEASWYFHRSDIPQTDVLDEIPTDAVIIGAEFNGPNSVIVHVAERESRAAQTASSPKGRTGSC